jgi:molecular chaperone DnaK
MENIVVGIDLGTTFSAVAYVDENGNPKVIPNADGKTTTPSVVMIENGQIVVGELALNQWVTKQDCVVRWIKRQIGNNDYRFQGFSPVQISAEILKTLRGDAQVSLGVPVEEAVITCPAYFSALEVENTKRAGELAGLTVKEIVKEPTAAAVHYGVDHMHDGETILVCDLGGGTYDATVLSYEKGIFIPRASMGDRQLGGHDWTMDFVELVAEHFVQAGEEDPRNDLVAGEMLYESCEQAKRDFARVTEVSIPCQIRGRIEQLKVSREEFEAKAEARILALVSWSEQAIEKASLTWRKIDKILLVGGSSRLRRVSLALEQVAGKKPTLVREPDLSVALGAAIIARGKVRSRRLLGGLVDAPKGGLVEVITKRILERHLGTRIFVSDGDRPAIANALLIPRGTELPASRTAGDFQIAVNGQKVFDVPIVEFEHESDIDIEIFHNFRFHCQQDAKKGDRIVVTFQHDANGVPSVTAMDERSRQLLRVERLPYEEPNLEEVMRIRVKPRWVVFAVDTSGSMQGIKMESAKRAVVENAKSLLAVPQSGCKVGVVRFDSDVEVICRPTADLREIEDTVSGMHTGGTTHMDEGIQQAVELVMGAPAGTDRDVVMVTDGQPDDDRRRGTLDAAAWAKDRGVTLSTVGIGSQEIDFRFLSELTPFSLVIDQVGQGQLSDSMMTLLTKAVAARGLLESS